MNYDKWQRRLKCVADGLNPKEWPVDLMATTEGATVMDLGFYRLPIKERKPNGQWKLLGYYRVELFMYQADGTVGCDIDGRTVTPDRLAEKFHSFLSHPIKKSWYLAVEKGERWPDDPVAPEHKEPAKSPDEAIQGMAECDYWNGRKSLSGIGHNDPPKVMTADDHASAIDNAIGAAPNTVKSEAEAAQALGFKNRIAELRLDADKAGKADYQPPYTEYKRLYKIWTPMIERAEQKEKQINTAILKFREAERQRIAKEQAAAEAKQREIEAANAQRATPLPVPEVAPVVAPAPIQSTYGTRKIKEELHTILDAITDYDAIYAFMRDEPKVKELLLELAAAKIKAGFTVPGTKTRQGLI